MNNYHLTFLRVSSWGKDYTYTTYAGTSHENALEAYITTHGPRSVEEYDGMTVAVHRLNDEGRPFAADLKLLKVNVAPPQPPVALKEVTL